MLKNPGYCLASTETVPQNPTEIGWKKTLASKLLVLFGARVKEMRQRIGIKQSELAERIGQTQQYVSLVESGRQNVTLKTAETLATALEGEVWSMLKPAAPSHAAGSPTSTKDQRV